MDDLLLQLVTQALFVLLFVLTLRDLAQHRDRPRLEVAALFGVFAITIVLQGLARAAGLNLPWMGSLGALLVVAQPYLLLRLVTHFRPVPPWPLRLGLLGLLGSWAVIIGAGLPLPPGATIALVLAFAAVEAYAAVAFVQAALTAGGIIRRRLLAITAGSGLLVAVFLLAGLAAALPAAAPVITPASRLLVLGSAIAYYLGFAPPRWLHRIAQMAELRRFLGALAGQSAEDRLTAALDQIGPAAARAVGGKAAVVALGDGDGDGDGARLRIHADPTNRDALVGARLTALALGPPAPVLTAAWRERRPVAAGDPRARDEGLQRLAAAFGGAAGVLAVPIMAHGQLYGLLIILLDRGPLFLEDDLALLAILAEQSALAIESGRLYDEARRRAAERQALLDLSQAISDQPTVAAVAEGIAAHLDRLLPAASAGVFLPTADGGLEIVATAGAADEERRGRRLPAGVGVTGRALSADAPVVVDDVLADPDHSALHAANRSRLVAPLRHRAEVLGALAFERIEVAAFRPEEAALARIVAAHAAQAIARARLLEQLQDQNAALEAASRLKSEFLANMSHELRTPLNAIIGFSQLLLDEPAGGYDRETATTYLGAILSGGEHLLALINDILDLAKVEAGRMELQPAPFLVEDLVAQVLMTVEPLAARQGVALAADADGVGEVVADAGKVKQILYNLVSNAIKFTPAGGRVTVEVRPLPDAVELTVADTGIGIAPADQERIFQEFQQVEAGPDRHYEGTGLGLALTRRFVELHGGRLWVESALGQGSRFHVALPLRAGAGDRPSLVAADAPPAADGAPGGDRPLVLVVEDEPHAANLLSLYLGRGGYRAHVVCDGREAVERARALQPVAIALDILLPGLDGWEVLRALKLDEATRDIPVVVTSVVDDEQLGYALGAVDYFVKPVDRQALLARLACYTFTTKVRQREVRVAVVDDDPAAVELLAGILKPAGFTVLTAGGGAAGVALVRAERPDLLLLDLMMPEVSGFDVVAALTADAATRTIPILVITAKDLTEADKRLLNGHVAAVLQKGTLAAVDLLAWLDESVRRFGGRRDDQ